MKKLINRVEDVLSEQLLGLARAHPELTLHQDPVYVTRADAPVAGKVALLSGGGSGHEPMHCGYIGQGMLSGACPGEIFTSPTPDKMFECAMTIDGGEGVLLIIKNYTGDILNFETATELLHESGVKVTTVVVDDDVAVKDSLYTAGRRGVANTVLIEKLVGAAAERGDSLDISWLKDADSLDATQRDESARKRKLVMDMLGSEAQLRSKLEHFYYARAGKEPIRIDIPRGGYIPTFETLLPDAAAHAFQDGGMAEGQGE